MNKDHDEMRWDPNSWFLSEDFGVGAAQIIGIQVFHRDSFSGQQFLYANECNQLAARPSYFLHGTSSLEHEFGHGMVAGDNRYGTHISYFLEEFLLREQAFGNERGAAIRDFIEAKKYLLSSGIQG